MEEFDFNKVGKRLPYTVPEHFFEEVTQTTLAQVAPKGTNLHQVALKRTIALLAGMAACLVLFFALYNPNNAPKNVDEFIADLSDEELSEVLLMTELENEFIELY